MSSGEPVLLADLAWPAIADCVRGGEALCLLPVGATEQHGPHLPASTDTDIATAICHGASRLTQAPVLPTLPFGASQAHTAKWPGTLSLPPRVLIDVVVSLARWVRASGFAKLLLVNAHVGNVAPLRVAVDEIRAAGELRAGLVSWYELTGEIHAEVRSDAEDWHAHAAETSLMLHLRPERVDLGSVRDDPDRTGELVFSYTVAETSREGLTGAPSRGSTEAGTRLFEAAVGALAQRIERGRHEEPPSLDGQ
jgi:creatinine amidohydrolase